MERERMEDEVLTTSLLAEEKRAFNSNGAGHSGNAESGSAVTALLILCTFVVTCGSFSYGCALGYSSPAESGIIKDLGITTAEYSVFGSMLTIGAMVGAMVIGKVGDIVGRRGAMWFLETFSIIGWLAIAFAKDAWVLDLGRISNGIAAGSLSYLTPIYTAEITPKNLRGGFIAFHQISLCCGSTVMFYLGNVITWRNLALVGAIPCVMQFIGAFFIPESPRWLAKTGKEKEVEPTLQRLRGKNVDVSQEAAEIRDNAVTLEQLSESRFVDMFRWKYAHSLIIGVGIVSLVQFGGANGILFYASSILDAAGSSSTAATTAVAAIQIPFAALGVVCMDKLGRRPTLMVAAAGACFGNLLAASAFLLQDHNQLKDLTAGFVLTGILLYTACAGLGLSMAPLVVMSEIFPMNIKSSAGSLATLASWFSSWIVTYAFNFIFAWSSAGIFFIFACFCASIIAFVIMLVPETKGKTLEEIQASLTQFFQ